MLFKCIGISGDYASGQLLVQKDEIPEASLHHHPEEQKTLFTDHKEQLQKETASKSEDTSFTKDQREIFSAHVVMMMDPEWEEMILDKISEGYSAVYAVYNASEEMAQMLEMVEDPYIRDRAIDVRDISKQLRNKILGVETSSLKLAGKVLVLEELSASDVSSYIEAKVSAVLSKKGGSTSHAAIIAKSLGLTYMSGVPAGVDQYDGKDVLIDVKAATLLVDPDEQTRAEWTKGAEEAKQRQAMLEARKMEDALTLDGVRVEVCGNIAGEKDVTAILANGCDGVALFRTEFLFLGDELPTEEEQYETYKAVLAKLGKPLTFRTLDIGGDKGSKFFPMEEENPFLGVRGLRLSMIYSDVFTTQIRAVLRAARDLNALSRLRIMYPMVSSRSDAEWGNNVVNTVAATLGIDTVNRAYKLGIMVEVPAVAMSVDSFAGVSDFISIGTNDLIQYTLASDRMNEGVRTYYNPYNPGFIRLLANAIQTARKNNIHVAVCGDLGSTPAFTSLLVGLGVQELGVVAPMIPAIKHAVRQSKAVSQGLVDRVLSARVIEEVKNALS